MAISHPLLICLVLASFPCVVFCYGNCYFRASVLENGVTKFITKSKYCPGRCCYDSSGYYGRCCGSSTTTKSPWHWLWRTTESNKLVTRKFQTYFYRFTTERPRYRPTPDAYRYRYRYRYNYYDTYNRVYDNYDNYYRYSPEEEAAVTLRMVGIITGIVVGAVTFLGIVITILVVICRRKVCVPMKQSSKPQIVYVQDPNNYMHVCNQASNAPDQSYVNASVSAQDTQEAHEDQVPLIPQSQLQDIGKNNPQQPPVYTVYAAPQAENQAAYMLPDPKTGCVNNMAEGATSTVEISHETK